MDQMVGNKFIQDNQANIDAGFITSCTTFIQQVLQLLDRNSGVDLDLADQVLMHHFVGEDLVDFAVQIVNTSSRFSAKSRPIGRSTVQ